LILSKAIALYEHLLQDDKEIIVCSKGGDLTDIFQEIASYYQG